MIRIVFGTLLLALAVPSFAELPSYNYINGSFETVELDVGAGPEVDGDGFGIGGSFVVADNWHIVGRYSAIGFDFGVDLNRFAIGGGYHTNVSDSTTVFADLTYVNWEVDTGAVLGSVDDSGYGFAVGVRSNVTERIELQGTLSLVDLGDGGDSTSFGGAAWYAFESFSLGVSAEIDDDVTSLGIGGRFFFDN